MRQRISRNRRPRRKGRRVLGGRLVLVLIALALLYLADVNGLQLLQQTTATQSESGEIILCEAPHIVDGDTLHCGLHKIRLASIDAPEISPCAPGRRCTPGNGQESKAHLQSLIAGTVRCAVQNIDKYGRKVAACTSGGQDLSCAMVKAGHALERYGKLECE